MRKDIDSYSLSVRRLCGANSRRCLQHGLQLFLKYFCTTIQVVATATAACNYLAKFSKLSRKFRAATGPIPPGTPTRWNSYVVCAQKVLDKFDAILSLYESGELTAKCKSTMEPHIVALKDANGLEALQDTITILSPLIDITIEEEGENYITSSAALSKLAQAKTILDDYITFAQRSSTLTLQGRLKNPAQIVSWVPTIRRLWDVYLAPFMQDELFQVYLTLVIRPVLNREIDNT